MTRGSRLIALRFQLEILPHQPDARRPRRQPLRSPIVWLCFGRLLKDGSHKAGYQQPHALNGRLLSGVPFARRPVRLCNGETIDAENE